MFQDEIKGRGITSRKEEGCFCKSDGNHMKKRRTDHINPVSLGIDLKWTGRTVLLLYFLILSHYLEN